MLGDSFTREIEGGFVDVFVTDEEGYGRFADDEDFRALAVQQASAGADGSVDLPADRSWYVVVANTQTSASTVIGDLSVGVAAIGEGDLPDPVTLGTPFRVGPGQHMALLVAPAQE